MKLRDEVAALGNEWTEYYGAYTGIANSHPPSLKNPRKEKTRDARSGWHSNSSKKSKQIAREDLAIIINRVRRQTGKPALAQTVNYSPVFAP